MKQILTILGSAARRIAAGAGRALRALCDIYVASLNQSGIYLAIGSRGTRYVGQTRTTIMQRWRTHISALRRNTHHNTPLQEVYNHGERFVIIPLEFVSRNSPPTLLDQREQYWIDRAGLAVVNVISCLRHSELK